MTLEIICVQCQHLGDNCVGNPPSQGPSSILLSQNLANMPQSVYFFCIDIPLQHVIFGDTLIGCCWLDCSSVELNAVIAAAPDRSEMDSRDDPEVTAARPKCPNICSSVSITDTVQLG